VLANWTPKMIPDDGCGLRVCGARPLARLLKKLDWERSIYIELQMRKV
jgi:hypothetical protein